MKLLLYKGTRPGLSGFGNWCVRFRTKSKYSHVELMFEESDGEIAALAMPDKSLNPDTKGARWCFGATATDIMPDWGGDRRRRAGKWGGVRFKRIAIDPAKWDVIELPYADVQKVIDFCLKHEGKAYDWRHIFTFFSVILLGVILNQFINQGEDHWTCGELIGAALGFELPEIFDPKTLSAVALTVLAYWKIKNIPDY